LIQGSILCGFDFPIGLPIADAETAGISNYLSVLTLHGFGKWKEFFSSAQTAQEISIYRPFYPDKPGHSCRAHLETGLK
jgi:hypothetical protein